MLVARPPHPDVHAEHGFTLIETLVAMVAAMIVAVAAFQLLIVTDEQTERATGYLESTQAGNIAMTHIVTELDSACIRYEFAPILAGSTGEKLIFQDAFSKEAEIPLSQIQKHEIIWKETEAGTGRGTLVDVKYTAAGETAGVYTWTKVGEKRIGERIAREKNGTTSEPIFRYYKYSSTPTDSSEFGESSLNSEVLPSELATQAQASEVASVAINFRALPTDGKAVETLGQSLDQRSQVTFNFTAPVAEPTISGAGPCE
jgi:type II secretory pathway pseudopilin PulG